MSDVIVTLDRLWYIVDYSLTITQYTYIVGKYKIYLYDL